MQTNPIQAKRPPFNAQMMTGAMKVVHAIEALTQNNFTVVSVELNTPTRPTITIQTCGNCRRMIEKGEAFTSASAGTPTLARTARGSLSWADAGLFGRRWGTDPVTQNSRSQS